MEIKEILKEGYQHCQDMQKIAETKNAGLIAFNSAFMLATIKLLVDGQLHSFFHIYCYFVLVCLIISIFLNFSAINAQLKHKEQEISNNKVQNLLFFGTIANFTPEEYLKQLNSEYKLEESETKSKYNLDLSRQVVINAQIALRKFKLFNIALKWTIAGLATPISILIFLSFFNNNK